MKIDHVALIKAQEKIVCEAQEEIRNLIANWAKESPVQPGDIVKVNGYSYRGKEMRIKEVTVKRRWGDRYEFYAKGPIIKADGTESLNSGEWTHPIDLDELK